MNDNLRQILDQQVCKAPFDWLELPRALRRLKNCEYTPPLVAFADFVEATVKPTRIKDRSDWINLVRQENALRDRYFELFKSGVIAELLQPGGMYGDDRNINVPDPLTFSRALMWSLNCNDPLLFLRTVYDLMCKEPDIVFECRYLDPTDRYFQLALGFLRTVGGRKPDWVEKYPKLGGDNLLQTPWFVSALEKVEKVASTSTEEELGSVALTRRSLAELGDFFNIGGRHYKDESGLLNVLLTPRHPPVTFSYQLEFTPARGGVLVELYISEDSRRSGDASNWKQYKLNRELLMTVLGCSLAQYMEIDTPYLGVAESEPLTDSIFVPFEDLSPNKFFYID